MQTIKTMNYGQDEKLASHIAVVSRGDVVAALWEDCDGKIRKITQKGVDSFIRMRMKEQEENAQCVIKLAKRKEEILLAYPDAKDNGNGDWTVEDICCDCGKIFSRIINPCESVAPMGKTKCKCVWQKNCDSYDDDRGSGYGMNTND